VANDVYPGATLRQLKEWGYPQGSLRSTPPANKAFSVVHITGNSRLPSAENELAWRINDSANQNSATFFVNRDGSIWQALGDPLHMDPWANGDVNRPDTSNPRIAALVADGVNANTRTIVAIENVGYEPGSSITAAQEAACAGIVAYYHAKAGVPISRQAIIGHYQLNSVSRPNCPGVNKALIDRIVTKAAGLANAVNEEDMSAITELTEKLENAVSRLQSCKDERDRLTRQVAKLQADITALKAASPPTPAVAAQAVADAAAAKAAEFGT
jgi:hypothetical protein